MSSVKEHLSKLREERLAREKARIEKLKELNLKKYSKTELPSSYPKPIPTHTASKCDIKNMSSRVKNNFHVNNTTKRPITAPLPAVPNNIKGIPVYNTTEKSKPIIQRNAIKSNEKSNIPLKKDPIETKIGGEKIAITNNNTRNSIFKIEITSQQSKMEKDNKNAVAGLAGFALVKNVKKDFIKSNKNIIRKSISQVSVTKSDFTKPAVSRKSFQPTKMTQSVTKINPKRQSVFERLYQPKHIQKMTTIADSEKLQNDPTFLNKVIKDTGLILNRGDLFGKKRDISVRRSISAVHFKRISKHEANNCVHKWSSIGEKLDKVHLKDIDEDAAVKEDKIVSAVKSERKKVKFQTPISNFDTPRPEELQAKLQSWLQKRGKSIDSFQHLQCFGIHHLPKEIKPLNLNTNTFVDSKPLSVDSEYFEDCLEDEDKENKPLESDSDDGSYDEMMNNKLDDEKGIHGNKVDEATWRHASYISDSVADLNDTRDSTLTCVETPPVDELAIGAINDLTQLLREGYSWEQCARWLRAIRERVPHAPRAAAYWECRAELEARRGDLPASVHCWEQACAQGTEDISKPSTENMASSNASAAPVLDASEPSNENMALSNASVASVSEDTPTCSNTMNINTALSSTILVYGQNDTNKQPCTSHVAGLKPSPSCFMTACPKCTHPFWASVSVTYQTPRCQEPSVVEANLDQLLDKFMQLKISPSSGQKKMPDSKLVDVKNVFKSTLIRFAVQQAKMRRSQELKLIVTPVRRSGRLSAAWSGKKAFRPPLVEFSSAKKCPRTPRTPLVECTTLKEATRLHPTTMFVPNEKLCDTP